MDFVELVESGKYKKEWLSDENKLIIKGMEVVLELLKDPLLFIKVKNEDFLHLQELVEEVQKKELEAIQKYVYANICEAIVGLYDEEPGTVGGQGCITVAKELGINTNSEEWKTTKRDLEMFIVGLKEAILTIYDFERNFTDKGIINLHEATRELEKMIDEKVEELEKDIEELTKENAAEEEE